MKQLREASIEALSQFRLLFRALKTNPHKNIYAKSDIGKHVRHVFEHYLLLRRGLEQEDGIVDYNNRDRGNILESDMTVAESLLSELLSWLKTDTLLDHDRPLFIVSELSCQQTISVKMPSFLMRELHYVTYHCIHHIAYCALLAKQKGIAVSSEIGLAPGTVTYLRAVNS